MYFIEMSMLILILNFFVYWLSVCVKYNMNCNEFINVRLFM